MNQLARDLLEAHPGPSLGWYVDDLSVDHMGTTRHSVEGSTAAVTMAMIAGTKQLGWDLAEDKVAVIASSMDLAKAVAKVQLRAWF